MKFQPVFVQILVVSIFFSYRAKAQNCISAFSLLEINSLEIQDLEVGNDGSILAAGSFNGNNQDFDPGSAVNAFSSPNSKNGFIANYDTDGGLNWVTTFGGDANLGIYDATVDAEGNIYVCGYCSGSAIDLDPGASSTAFSTPANTSGMFVASYTAVGNYRWGFVIPAEYNWQLSSVVTAYKIDVDKDGNVFVCGIFQTTNVDFDPGEETHSYSTTAAGGTYNYDAFLVKYSPDGKYIWSVTIQSDGWDTAQALKTDGNGNVYWCGNFSGNNTTFSSGDGSIELSSAGNTDIFLSKHSSGGNVIWVKTMGGLMDDQANQLQIDADTNVYISGIYQETVDMDPGSGLATITSLGNYDCFFAKYNKHGDYVFAKSVGGYEFDNIYETVINSDNNTISITGLYKARAHNDFDPGSGVKTLTTTAGSGNNSLFAATYNSMDGGLIWATSGTCGGGMQGVSILPLQEGAVAVAGKFYGAGGSIPAIGDNLFALAPQGSSGIFIATLSTATGIPLVKTGIFNIYPNPVISEVRFIVENMEVSGPGNVLKLFNNSGILLYENKGNIRELEAGINKILPGLSNGNYHITLSNSTIFNTAKFIKR